MVANLCIRCGRVRIVAKTWKEKIVSNGIVSVVEHTEMVCPNKDCQAKVDKELANRRKKSEEIERNKKERDSARRTRIVNLRLGKAKKSFLKPEPP